jgi:hypothetical protein
VAAATAFPVVMMGAVLAGVGGIIYAGVLSERKRNAAMQTVAQTMGFAYEEECDPTTLGSLTGALPVFFRGHSRKARRMMRGKLSGRTAALFDYTYTTGGGKSAHTHRQTVLLLPDGGRGLPDFSLSPENFLHRIAEAFGYQDIDFPDFPDFSKHYLLRGPDEEAIRRVFNSQTLSLLGGTTGWHVEARDGRLAVFREGRYTDAAEIPSYASDAVRVAGSFPVTS